ncbi:MAG: 23S rRNA (uracil(1939)-C(5))-methyltransferase RlmD [Tenericutes bacterium HGW-Tenericutes-1]|jgi:23S rRNA (uracil1939-C5)-methyltransferase|nr:MAG: 23S rRNA (uracil(1939)-C(5))-methyltransferase RlmD [Tenericutes bacterium HGW-Tenericutes-1]
MIIENARCESMDLTGYGIIKHNGKDFHIANLLPGELAKVDVFDHGYGKVIKILESSKDRVKAPCPIYSECGGCHLQHLEYSSQISLKTNYVKSSFESQGLSTSTLLPCIGMKDPYHYRNKVQMVFSEKGKRILSGFYEENTHRVINVDNCHIQDEVANKIISTCKELFLKHKIKPYMEDRGTGLVRHVLVKRSKATEEVLVVIVTIEEMFPGRNNFVTDLRKLHPEITTIVQNINGRKTSVVLGDFERIIFGKGVITDVLMNKKFVISSKSFYQVNARQTEILYKKAIELAKPTETDVVLDAYSGIGTIGILMSEYVKKVISVEINPISVKNAIQNARINNIKNVRFYHEDAAQFIKNLVSDNIAIDIVLVDPPRAGLEPSFIDAMLELRPKKMVYISCDPTTLARDIKLLTAVQYEIKRIQPVDMFAQTFHVESITLLSLR